MISTTSIQKAYIDLYKELRAYIWDYNVVELIAELEIETYKQCPNIESIRRCLSKIGSEIAEVMREDELLENAYQEFADLLDSDDTVYSKLYQVREVE